MTVQEYLKLKKGNYTHHEGLEMDRFVKEIALENAKVYFEKYPKNVREYLGLMVKFHYGSVETDDFLISIGAYPCWV